MMTDLFYIQVSYVIFIIIAFNDIMRLMKLLYKLFPKDLRINTFNKGWWFYIGLTIVGLILFSAYGNTLPMEERRKLILITSILEFIFLRFYKHYMMRTHKDYNYFTDLPCYLCNQSTIMCIIAALTNNTHLMAFCIILGTGGSLLAFTFPDKCLVNQRFYSVQTFGFYFYHGLLIVTCLSFYTLGLYKPQLIDALWNALMILVSGIIDHILNVILVKTGLNPIANYDFTMYPDNAFLEKLYAFYPKPLLYLIPVVFICGLLSFVILLIL